MLQAADLPFLHNLQALLTVSQCLIETDYSYSMGIVVDDLIWLFLIIFPWILCHRLLGTCRPLPGLLMVLESLILHLPLVDVKALWSNPRLSLTGKLGLSVGLFCISWSYLILGVLTGGLQLYSRHWAQQLQCWCCAFACNRDQTPAERAKLGIKDNLVRFSCGIEDSEDIFHDILQSLDAL
jgi:hypothetical protein